MSYRLVIRYEAEVDITDAAIWYQKQQKGLGDEFVAEVHSTIESVTANPRQFPRLRRTPEVRRAFTNRFPHRVFFVLRPDSIQVFRVLHTARRDSEWRRAVPK